ncbi:MAG: hypothetical protein HDR47_00820 [Bacteroides sp.]|nr:hypothetical protein [Bacteroides sp.]MBD5419758.1 hypothetical protein [Bacteroides sp.]
MGIYKVSTKGTMNSAGYHIEPGMSVEISTINPISGMSWLIAPQVQNAFLSKYGVDLKAMNCLHAGFLKVEKLK